MKLDDIFAEWESDCNINKNELGDEALNISKLHFKYYRIFANERLVLKKYESELKTLRLDKYEFYTQGPTKDHIDKGWKLPAVGRVLKSDVSNYLDADQEIIQLNLKIGMQHEKIDFLESILKTLHNRNFNIRAAIDWAKFQAGA